MQRGPADLNRVPSALGYSQDAHTPNNACMRQPRRPPTLLKTSRLKKTVSLFSLFAMGSGRRASVEWGEAEGSRQQAEGRRRKKGQAPSLHPRRLCGGAIRKGAKAQKQSRHVYENTGALWEKVNESLCAGERITDTRSLLTSPTRCAESAAPDFCLLTFASRLV